MIAELEITKQELIDRLQTESIEVHLSKQMVRNEL